MHNVYNKFFGLVFSKYKFSSTNFSGVLDIFWLCRTCVTKKLVTEHNFLCRFRSFIIVVCVLRCSFLIARFTQICFNAIFNFETCGSTCIDFIENSRCLGVNTSLATVCVRHWLPHLMSDVGRPVEIELDSLCWHLRRRHLHNLDIS